MAYLLNNIDLSTYGIIAGRANSSNIAVSGCFDMPERIGTVLKDWGDEDGVEPYTDADEIFLGGRDISFYGSVFGTYSEITDKLDSFNEFISGITGLSVFVTPYGSFNIIIKRTTIKRFNGAVNLTIEFREPVIQLPNVLELITDEANNPITAENGVFIVADSGLTFSGSEIILPLKSNTLGNSIDSILFSSFGLSLIDYANEKNIADRKEQHYISYGAESIDIVKREHKFLELNAIISSTDIAGFIEKTKLLFYIFTLSGLRSIRLVSGLYISCFSTQGFKISDVYMDNGQLVANFKISLIITEVQYLEELTTESGIKITTESGALILV